MYSASSTASSMIEPQQAAPQSFRATWNWTKASWPNAELSAGGELSSFDRSHRCWETVGPALDLATRISREVRKLLDERYAYLNDGEPIDSYVSFGLYMIGRRKEKSNPTLLFICPRPSPRKRAKELVKESHILQGYPPGIRLAEGIRTPYRILNRPSQTLSPFRLLVGGDQRYSSAGKEPEPRNIYCISPVDRTCGVPIFTKKSDGLFRKATIGGIVMLGDTYYALTVAHVFVDDDLVYGEDSEEEISDIGGEFDSDSESDSEERQHRSRLDARASIYSDSRPSETVRERTRHTSQSTPLSEAYAKIDSDVARDSAVGQLFQYSTHTGLDWALIDIDNDLVDPKQCNSIQLSSEYEERTLWPRSLVTTGPAERQILAITGDKGVIHGFMSQSLTYMRTKHTRGFQELWTIYMNSELVEGDCGSWVVDCENGQLYGHIVAGHPGTGVGYIVPASQIFESVWQTLGDAVVLPSGVSTTPQQPRTTSYSISNMSASPLGIWEPRHNLQMQPRKEGHQPLLRPRSPETDIRHVTTELASNRLDDYPACDACLDRDVSCDATDEYSCTQCARMHFRCQFTRQRIQRIDTYIGSRDEGRPSHSYEVSRIESPPMVSELPYRPIPMTSSPVGLKSWRDLSERRTSPTGFKEKPKLGESERNRRTDKSESVDDNNDEAIARILQRNERDSRRSGRRSPSPVDVRRPIYTRMARRYLSLETLRFYNIDYEVEQAGPDYILVKRWVPESEQNTLWDHTKQIREHRQDREIEDRRSQVNTGTSVKSGRSGHTPSLPRGSEQNPPYVRRLPIHDRPSDTVQLPMSPNFPEAQRLPEDWESNLDPASGHTYYIHIPTQVTQWEFPTNVDTIQNAQFLDREGDLASSIDPLPFGVISPQSLRDNDGAGTSQGIVVTESTDISSGFKKVRHPKPKRSDSKASGSKPTSEASSEIGSSKGKDKKGSHSSPLLNFFGGGKKK